MKSNRSILALGLALILGLTSVGCAKAPSAADPGKTDETKPVTETKPAPTSPYASIIDGIRQQIPYVTKDESGLLPEGQQSEIVAKMKALVKAKSDSKTLFAAFEADITHLNPENADAFATAVLAGLRKNSFEDYKPYETFFGAMGNSPEMDAFFEGAKAYQYNYYQLKLHPEAIKVDKVKAQLAEAASQGYLLMSSEGMIYPVVDYGALAKYKAYYSPDFAAILDQEAFSVIDILVSDAALIVPVDHIAALVLEADQQIQAATNEKYKKYLAMMYQDYLRMIFFGTDNTPMYDYDSGLLREEVAALYKKMAGLSDTKTAGYVQAQMAILEASGGKYNEDVTKQINALLDKVLADYGVTESDKNAYYNWMSGESYE